MLKILQLYFAIKIKFNLGGIYMMVNSEVRVIIEKMLNDDRKVVNGKPETNWTVLVNNKIFSRAVPVPMHNSKTYEEN